MKNYLYLFVKIVENSLLSIFFIIFSTHAMELERQPGIAASSRDCLMQQKKIEFFDPQKLMNNGIKWTDAIPKKMLIASNQKGWGAFVGVPGKVCYVNFGNYGERYGFGPSDPHPLIQHTNKMTVPMFDVVEMQDHQLVVSICNYKNEENRRVAECIVSRNTINPNAAGNSHNLFVTKYEIKSFNKAIQAMALTPDGTMLVMARDDSFIEVIDFATEKSMTSKFMLPISEHNETDAAIVGIAVKSCSKKITIAAVNSDGIINIKQLFLKKKYPAEEESKEVEFVLSHLKYMACGDKWIEKIGLVGEDCDLLYTLPKGTTKIIRAHDWVEIPGRVMNEIVKSYIFSQNKSCKKVAVDQGYQCATIHWPKKREGLAMEVVRENGHAIEKYMLIANNDAQSTVNCIGEGGQNKALPLHVLVAALKDERAANISADGYLRHWVLPGKQRSINPEDIQHVGLRKLAMLDAGEKSIKPAEFVRPAEPVDKLKKLARERSSSLPVIEKKKSHKDKAKQDKDVDGEHKEKSFGFMGKTSSATKVSPKTSPTTSRSKLDKKRKSITRQSDKEYRDAMQKDATNDFSSQRSQDPNDDK